VPAVARRWPWLVATWLALAAGAASGGEREILARGEYVFRASGCLACHTDEDGGGLPLAGGRALVTPLGTFYSPNITPDPEHGIGRWSEADFARALTAGVAPDGSPYYPSFPYTSYTRMRPQDVAALWAYLRTVAPAPTPDRPHDLPRYLGVRAVNWVWRALYFSPGALPDDPSRSPEWNRGAYLAEAMAHCGECHTPRDALGGLDPARRYAGTAQGPEGAAVPNITPDRQTGIGRWRANDLADYLASGATPSGDYAGGLMAEVIEHGTRHLTDADRAALATYVLSQPAIENSVGRKDRKEQKSRGEFE
jgi:mono/diheme cytochrome c family protein